MNDFESDRLDERSIQIITNLISLMANDCTDGDCIVITMFDYSYFETELSFKWIIYFETLMDHQWCWHILELLIRTVNYQVSYQKSNKIIFTKKSDHQLKSSLKLWKKFRTLGLTI